VTGRVMSLIKRTKLPSDYSISSMDTLGRSKSEFDGELRLKVTL